MIRAIATTILCATVLAAAAQPTPLPSEMFTLDIKERSAPRALQELANATGVRFVFGSSDVRGVMVNPVTGEMNYDTALRRMLAGTGLTFRTDELSGEVVIVPRGR